MQLIGITSSPYVRRVAISLDLLDIPFEQVGLSTYKDFDRFKAINPVAKAPTLVCDNGQIILDSSLILQFAERHLSAGKTLWPVEAGDYQYDMSAVSLALAACEKAVQIVHEAQLRPEAFRFDWWLDRILQQALAAFDLLENEIVNRDLSVAAGNGQASLGIGQACIGISQACITAAVVWKFTQWAIAESVPVANFPALENLSRRMEATPAFQKWALPS